MSELEDEIDSKSIVPKGRVGSTPTRGTKEVMKIEPYFCSLKNKLNKEAKWRESQALVFWFLTEI